MSSDPNSTAKNGATPKKKPDGMDALLSHLGKNLGVGEKIRIPLIKIASGITVADPVHSKAPPQVFPLVAKFSESVVKPDFGAKNLRLYQQDVPAAQDDWDEEESATIPQKKKRWRRAQKAKPRQWILQDETEFLETMMAKRQRKAPPPPQVSSSYYEGFPEHNPSHYALLGASEDHTKIQVTMLQTPYAVQSFTQPRSNAALTMKEAEQALEDQRFKVSRFMMHKKVGTSKGRLLGKLQSQAAEGEDEDAMGDLRFKERKGVGSKARKELLNSMADEGLKVDEDGVLGGTNDAEFGGKRHFGRLKKDGDDKKASAEQQRGTAAVGNDGLAMSDDFYQRDVVAEYDDLDYDANEQFEDDDVDMGEAEVHVDPSSGFADDEVDESEEEYDDAESGAEGLATVAGFRALLAKARGETPLEEEAAEEKEGEKKNGSRPSSPKNTDPAAAAGDDSKPAAKMDTLAQAKAVAKKGATESKSAGVELDEHGQRVLTLDAIRKEIWLHHGAIRMKRLMKIFDIKKKSSAERQNKFRELVRELCTMKVDPVEGNMLVLKQHYAHMG